MLDEENVEQSEAQKEPESPQAPEILEAQRTAARSEVQKSARDVLGTHEKKIDPEMLKKLQDHACSYSVQDAMFDGEPKKIAECLEHLDFITSHLQELPIALRDPEHRAVAMQTCDYLVGCKNIIPSWLQREVSILFCDAISEIEEALPFDPEELVTMNYLQCLGHVLDGSFSDEEAKKQRILAKRMLAKHWTLMRDAIENNNWGANYYEEPLASLLTKGYAKDQKKCEKWYKNYCRTSDNFSTISDLVMDVWARDAVKGERLLDEVFAVHGWSKEVYLESWKRNCGKDKKKVLPYYLSRNLNYMLQLESEEKGAASTMHKEFGITNFCRYDRNMLFKQYQEREDKDIPYGIIVLPQDDHNGGFNSMGMAWSYLTESMEDLDKKNTHVGLRMMEVETKHELLKRLAMLNKRYGEKQKISFALLGGHGNTNSIQLGPKNDEQHSLYLDDLRSACLEGLREYFVEGFPLILDSCSTGADGGIAQEISRVMQCRVTGPSIPTAMNKFTVWKRWDGKIDTHVRYRDEESVRRFKDGERLQ